MERRQALKSVFISAAGLVTLPAWGNNWNHNTLFFSKLLFDKNQEQLITILVDSLIPSGIISGAKDLGVPTFIQKMLIDCYEPSIQNSFKSGLEKSDSLAKETFGKPLIECDATQKNELLKMLSASTDIPQKDFYALLKNLTILGYTTSEYVLTKHLNYNMAPGHYYGCVNV